MPVHHATVPRISFECSGPRASSAPPWTAPSRQATQQEREGGNVAWTKRIQCHAASPQMASESLRWRPSKPYLFTRHLPNIGNEAGRLERFLAFSFLPAGRYRSTLLSSASWRSEEHTSELQSRLHLVCRLLLEKKKKTL